VRGRRIQAGYINFAIFCQIGRVAVASDQEV